MSPQEAKDRNQTTREPGAPEKTQPAATVQPQESIAPGMIRAETPQQAQSVAVSAEVKTPLPGPEYSEEASSKLKDVFHTLFAFDLGDTRSATPENFLISVQDQLGAAGITPGVDAEAYIRGILNNRDKLKKAIKEGVVDAQEAGKYIAALNAEAITARRDYEDTLNKNFLDELDKEGLRFGAGAGTEPPPEDEEERRRIAREIADEFLRSAAEREPMPAVPLLGDPDWPVDNAEQMERLAIQAFAETIRNRGEIPRQYRKWFWESAYFRMAFLERLLYVYDILPTTPSREFQDIVIQMIPRQFMDILQDPENGLGPEVTRELAGFYAHYQSIREKAHDIAIIAETQELKDLTAALEVFRTEMWDQAQMLPGVGTAKRVYEVAWEILRVRNNGMLPYEQIAWNPRTRRSELDTLARKLFEQLNRIPIFTRIVDLSAPQEHQRLTNLEVNRALAMARSLMLMEMRSHEHVAKSGPPTPYTEYLKSFYGEKITRGIDVVRWLIVRFGIGKDQTNKTISILAVPQDYKKTFFFSRDVILRSVWNIGPERLVRKLIEFMNISGAGNWMTGSFWRIANLLHGDSRDPGIQRLRRNAGFTMRLAMLHEAASEHAQHIIKRRAPNESKAEALWEREQYSNETKRMISDFELEGFDTREDGREVHFEGARELLMQLAHRHPLRIAWMIKDLNLMQYRDIYNEALGRAPLTADAETPDDLKRLITEIEGDLAVLAQVRMSRDFTSDDPLAFAVIEDGERRERARITAAFVGSLINPADPHNDTGELRSRAAGFRDTLGTKEWEYAPVYEDIPWEDLEFIKQGGRAFARKANDASASERGWSAIAELLMMLPTMKNPEEIIHYLKEKVHKSFAEYNNRVANRVIFYLGWGITNFFRKDWKAELPIFGTIYGAITGKASVAEYAYTREAMAWDERARHKFIHGLAGSAQLSPAQERILSQYVGATPLNRISWWARGTFISLLFATLIKAKEEVSKGIKV